MTNYTQKVIPKVTTTELKHLKQSELLDMDSTRELGAVGD